MKALVFDPSAPRKLALADAPAPKLTPSRALVEIRAISLNFGEVTYLEKMRKPGEVPGWDAAGVVLRAAADGSGPKEGTRVLTFDWSGGWAEQRAVDTSELAPIPDAVDFERASALPVAGVTALRSLRALGPILGRRVLVTGAAGGVGRFAVQLAHRAGAHVVASVGSKARGAGLRELGADEIVVGVDGLEEDVHGVIDNVGGSLLAHAFAHLARGGCVQSVGMASREPTAIDFEAIRNRGGGNRIEAFTVGPNFGADLTFLLSLVEKGELDVPIGWRGGWKQVDDAITELVERRVNGKAVLKVGE